MIVDRRLLVAALFCASPALAQDHSAANVHELVAGLTVTARVLIIGASPGDADADLIAWLARGRHVETGYLSLTRGESGTNFTGAESGTTLGAIRTAEVLAARRIDGARQFFTRAYDFGQARSAGDAFLRWDHTTLLGDVVTIVRSFRPHVIVARAVVDTLDKDGKRQASAIIAREVFEAALDTIRFPALKFGEPWSPTSLYEPGDGVTIDARDYDTVRGTSYAEIAASSRSQLRSFGFDTPPWQFGGIVHLRRRAVPGSLETGTGSLFDGVDTTFVRLQSSLPVAAVRQVLEIAAKADSARLLYDADHPERIAGYLARVNELTSLVRKAFPPCRHPTRDALVSLSPKQRCDIRYLDIDASIDLVQERATDAYLAAAGVSIRAEADRELLAAGDTAVVMVTVFNHGNVTMLVNDITVSGAQSDRMLSAIRVQPHSSAQVTRLVTSIKMAHPWWLYQRFENFYPPSLALVDGVERIGFLMRQSQVNGLVVPEELRRLTDVNATITIGTATLTSSVASVVYRAADPVVGVQDRALSGLPPVTMVFERAVQWAQAGKPLKRDTRVAIKSYSDRPQQFTLGLTPDSAAIVRLDSLPRSLTLASHEWRELSLPLRGTPKQKRYEVSLRGIAPADTFETGFKTAQYSYLPPLYFFRQPSVYVQGVDVEIPARLNVVYVRGPGEDADVSLKQLGVPIYPVNNEGLLRFELDGISTIVIGPDAVRADPGLIGQMPRLMEFVRKGGTIVMMNNQAVVTQPGILPFPVSFATPMADRAMEDAPVVAVDKRARVLTWPNAIKDTDWVKWSGERVAAMPTTADPRYARVIGMADPGEKENRNAILVATVGKGRFVYTSLTFPQQIANAVPGAMRLFINLLSAGLPP